MEGLEKITYEVGIGVNITEKGIEKVYEVDLPEVEEDELVLGQHYDTYSTLEKVANAIVENYGRNVRNHPSKRKPDLVIVNNTITGNGGTSSYIEFEKGNPDNRQCWLPLDNDEYEILFVLVSGRLKRDSLSIDTDSPTE